MQLRGAIKSYFTFRFMQPQIEEQGLFRMGKSFIIHCPGLDGTQLADNGKPIQEWFNYYAKIITTPITLSPKIPDGAERIMMPAESDFADGVWHPFTQREFYSWLNLHLPHEFPNFCFGEFDFDTRTVEILISNMLDQTLEAAYVVCWNRLQTDLKPIFIVRKNLGPMVFERSIQGDIDLAPAKMLRPHSLSSEAVIQLKRDEEFWIRTSAELFTKDSLEKESIVPKGFLPSTAACLLDTSVTTPGNLRTYLSIFRIIYIVAPLEVATERVLNAFRVSESEFLELTRLGRIKLLFPQSLDRYRASIVDGALNVSPENVLLSRRLCALTVTELRGRNPLFFSSLPHEDKLRLLKALNVASISHPSENVRLCLGAIRSELSRMWSTTNDLLDARGAFGVAGLGYGLLVPAMIAGYGKIEPLLSLSTVTAAQSVEWSAALNSTAVPLATIQEGPIFAMASLYSGMPLPVRRQAPFVQNMNFGVSEILAIDNDAPVIKFAKMLNTSDVDRFRHVVFKMASESTQQGDMEEAVESFNKQVRKIEKTEEHWAKWNINALLRYTLVGGVKVLGVPKGVEAAATPLINWFIPLLDEWLESVTKKDATLRATMDALRHFPSDPSSVLVARMRNDIKALK